MVRNDEILEAGKGLGETFPDAVALGCAAGAASGKPVSPVV